MSNNYKLSLDNLSSFIDDLNEDINPYSNYLEELDEDTEKIFETIRAVKRLKSSSINNSYNIKKKIGFWTKVTTVAAALIISVVGFSQHLSNDGTSILRAMAESYEQLNSYTAKMEMIYESGGKIEISESREIYYKKPHKFHSTTYVKERTFTRIYDGGEMMVSFHGERPDEIIIDFMGPETVQFYNERYHLGYLVEEILGAPEVIKHGKEDILGRSTQIYEYRYDKDAPFHRVWIDRSINLPIKMQWNSKNGDRITHEYTELIINPNIEDAKFVYNVSPNQRIHYTSERPKEALENAQTPRGLISSQANYIGRIDNNFVELELIGSPYKYTSFKLTEELKELINTKDFTNNKVIIQFQLDENEIPILLKIE